MGHHCPVSFILYYIRMDTLHPSEVCIELNLESVLGKIKGGIPRITLAVGMDDPEFAGDGETVLPELINIVDIDDDLSPDDNFEVNPQTLQQVRQFAKGLITYKNIEDGFRRTYDINGKVESWDGLDDEQVADWLDMKAFLTNKSKPKLQAKLLQRS